MLVLFETAAGYAVFKVVIIYLFSELIYICLILHVMTSVFICFGHNDQKLCFFVDPRAAQNRLKTRLHVNI